MATIPPIPAVAVRTTFARNMRQKGWTLKSDVAVREGEVISGLPELVPLLKQGERSLTGDTLLARAADLGCQWGQRHAETLLENQHLIPEEARTYYLVFPGTVWQDPRGNQRVAYLGRGDNRRLWFLDFYWLVGNFYSVGHLRRPLP
jgi:hypothetical protein